MAKYIIIPARLKSTRLPGKVLLNIGGKPMLQRVFEVAKECGFDDVFIATDEEQVREVAKSFGAKVCITSTEHQSGTDRIAEAVVNLGLNDDDVVVNVQGDEPFIPVDNIQQVAELLINKDKAVMATLCEKITSEREVFDPNCVKVVFDKNKYALYFSRATIPWERGFSEQNKVNTAEYFRHVGIYSYRVSFLKEYSNIKQSPLETFESLEQLRVLWHGQKIAIDFAQEQTPVGIDTQEDLDEVRKMV